jgi:hypothetical protein
MKNIIKCINLLINWNLSNTWSFLQTNVILLDTWFPI